MNILLSYLSLKLKWMSLFFYYSCIVQPDPIFFFPFFFLLLETQWYCAHEANDKGSKLERIDFQKSWFEIWNNDCGLFY